MGGDGESADIATLHGRVVSAFQVAKVSMRIAERDVSPNVVNLQVHGFFLE